MHDVDHADPSRAVSGLGISRRLSYAVAWRYFSARSVCVCVFFFPDKGLKVGSFGLLRHPRNN